MWHNVLSQCWSTPCWHKVITQSCDTTLGHYNVAQGRGTTFSIHVAAQRYGKTVCLNGVAHCCGPRLCSNALMLRHNVVSQHCPTTSGPSTVTKCCRPALSHRVVALWCDTMLLCNCGVQRCCPKLWPIVVAVRSD